VQKASFQVYFCYVFVLKNGKQVKTCILGEVKIGPDLVKASSMFFFLNLLRSLDQSCSECLSGMLSKDKFLFSETQAI
jgi:hypothetical protein